MDDPADTLQSLRVDGAGSWVPRNPVDTRRHVTAAHRDDRTVTGGDQRWAQRGPDEAARAGDQNLHGPAP